MKKRPFYNLACFNSCKATCLRFGLLAGLLGAICLTGCQAPPQPRIKGTEPHLVRPVVLQTTMGRSVENRPIPKIVLGDGRDVVLILATIHGNEPAGTPLAEMLADHLKQNVALLDGRRVVIMPVTNPDGMAGNTRANAQGVDLNRNFDAPNRQDAPEHGPFALSEPESQTISQVLMLYHPNRIVAIHQPLNCIDYDGPGERLARHIAAKCDLPVRKLGARPGSLGAFAGETLNIPIINMELKPDDHMLPRNQLWARYGAALLAAVTYPGYESTQLGQ